MRKSKKTLPKAQRTQALTALTKSTIQKITQPLLKPRNLFHITQSLLTLHIQWSQILEISRNFRVIRPLIKHWQTSQNDKQRILQNWKIWEWLHPRFPSPLTSSGPSRASLTKSSWLELAELWPLIAEAIVAAKLPHSAGLVAEAWIGDKAVVVDVEEDSQLGHGDVDLDGNQCHLANWHLAATEYFAYFANLAHFANSAYFPKYAPTLD